MEGGGRRGNPTSVHVAPLMSPKQAARQTTAAVEAILHLSLAFIPAA